MPFVLRDYWWFIKSSYALCQTKISRSNGAMKDSYINMSTMISFPLLYSSNLKFVHT